MFGCEGIPDKKAGQIKSARLWNKGEGYVAFRSSNIFEISGRRLGSWFQHRCIRSHRSFVNCVCVGREGRLPCMVQHITVVGWF